MAVDQPGRHGSRWPYLLERTACVIAGLVVIVLALPFFLLGFLLCLTIIGVIFGIPLMLGSTVIMAGGFALIVGKLFLLKARMRSMTALVKVRREEEKIERSLAAEAATAAGREAQLSQLGDLRESGVAGLPKPAFPQVSGGPGIRTLDESHPS
jgi:hypothetical protein